MLLPVYILLAIILVIGIVTVGVISSTHNEVTKMNSDLLDTNQQLFEQIQNELRLNITSGIVSASLP
jgi:predicted amino acid-binding ACT domain protein